MTRSWRIGALLAGAAFAVLLVWGLSQMQARREAENQLINRYQQAFFDSIGHVENVEVLLSKGIASSAPEQIVSLFADLAREASAAQANLTQLPLQQGTMMRTSRFLTQVGDFAYSMTRQAAGGSPPDSDSSDLMQRMRREAELLSAALHRIQQEAGDGPMPWEELRRGSNATLREDSKHIQQTGFTRLESHFQQIPTIQYDGPFSDHLLQREPRGLVGERVSEARAEEIALRFIGGNREAGAEAQAIRRVEGGDIPAYTISVDPPGDRAEVVMDVSIKGGHIVWMIDKRQVGSAQLSLNDAIDRAQRFLEERGFENMTPTYASQADNRAVIPFVPEIDGVRIYPDLLKVTVALDDGSIVGYEALGYLMSHQERTIDSPEVSAADAREQVASRLNVTDEPRLALIPTPTLNEVLTWEVAATHGEELFLVYVNAANGKEEQVLRIVQTSEGDLAL